jgi:hypothetical protein
MASYLWSCGVRSFPPRRISSTGGYSIGLLILLYRSNNVCELRRVYLVSCSMESVMFLISSNSACALGVHLVDLGIVFHAGRGQQIGDSGMVAVGLYCFVELAAQYSAYMDRGLSSRNTAVASDTHDIDDARRPFTPSLSSPPRCLIMLSMPSSCHLSPDSSLPITSLIIS